MQTLVRSFFFSTLILPSMALGCGIGWTEPKSHFDGVDYQGHVMQVEKLGDLDAGRGLSLPIFAVFTSHSGNNSPYAGHGWSVPLLESRMLQVDENGFKLDQPDGWFRMFGRDKDNPNILNGQGGWKAEIRGDTITAWADCGSKLVFNKGRLVAMQLKDRKFDVLYEGNRVSEIREGAMPILQVEKKAITGEVTGFRLADNRQIALELSQRPRVQVINNQNLVGGMDQSLSKITKADGTVRSIEYAVDDKLNPTMKLGDHLIVWNPDSKTIIKDGIWTYDIKPGAGPFDNAAIGRKNSNNQSEFWHRDGAKGEEIVQGIDGVKNVTSWFTSGKLAGKIRKVEEFRGNSSNVLRQLSYNEEGRLVREVSENGRAETFTYDQEGNRFSSTKPMANSDELDRIEQTWKEIIESKTTDNVTLEVVFYDLALFYIGQRHDSSSARDVAQLILNPQRRFNVVLQSYDHDRSLSPEEKIAHFQRLQQEYPDKARIITELIALRKKEL
jgi:YD repeat-containing protein